MPPSDQVPSKRGSLKLWDLRRERVLPLRGSDPGGVGEGGHGWLPALLSRDQAHGHVLKEMPDLPVPERMHRPHGKKHEQAGSPTRTHSLFNQLFKDRSKREACE